MPHDRNDLSAPPAGNVKRILTKDLEPGDTGRPLSDRARQAQRSVEAYLRGGGRPQWMERVAEIDRRVAAERRRLEATYRGVARECRGDAALFARRWREVAERCAFDGQLNELIALHNEWYPIERALPMDLRTRDYVLVNGRSYRRPHLDPWVLEQFPADLPAAAD